LLDFTDKTTANKTMKKVKTNLYTRVYHLLLKFLRNQTHALLKKRFL
jgi:hypothetical protein